MLCRCRNSRREHVNFLEPRRFRRTTRDLDLQCRIASGSPFGFPNAKTVAFLPLQPPFRHYHSPLKRRASFSVVSVDTAMRYRPLQHRLHWNLMYLSRGTVNLTECHTSIYPGQNIALQRRARNPFGGVDSRY